MGTMKRNLILCGVVAALVAPGAVQAATGPDLIVDDVIVRVRSRTQGSFTECVWTVVAIVKNIGDTAVTDDFFVRARLDGADTAGQVEVTRNVRPDQRVRARIVKIFTSPQTRNYGATADRFDAVTESNEGNNTTDHGNVTCP
jgi:hypothetical protein